MCAYEWHAAIPKVGHGTPHGGSIMAQIPKAP